MTGKVLLYVTCAIGGDEASLRAFHFEPETGALSELSQASGLSDGLTGPIFSACDNRGLFLYVADPVPDVDGSPGGAVVSFKIDRETQGLRRGSPLLPQRFKKREVHSGRELRKRQRVRSSHR